MSPHDTIHAILGDILAMKGSNPGPLDGSCELYAEGLGLDSMDTAELSARLERELGRDPFSTGVFPRTVAELVAFYETA